MTPQGIATPAGKNALLALLQARRLSEAKTLAETLCRAEPQDAEAWNLLGVVHGDLGENEAEEACFRRAIELRPDYLKAQRNLAKALMKLGRAAEAFESLRAFVRLNPEDAEAHYSLGNLLYDQGDHKAAEGAYRDALRLNPEHVQAHNNLGVVCTELKRLEEAIACHRRALELKPDHVETYYNLGYAYHAGKRFEEAVAAHQSALRLKPEYIEALLGLAFAHRALGKPEEAVRYLQEALRIQPDYAPAHYSLGDLWREQDRWAEAETCYEAAIRYQADYPEAWNNLGLALTAQKNYPKAIACFEEALRLKSDCAETHNNLGVVYIEQKRTEEAITCFKEAIRLKPDYIAAYNSLGVLYFEQDRLEEAVEILKSALRINPGAGETYENLGVVLREEAPFEAMDYLKKGLEVDPGNLAMLETLGGMQRNLGMLDDAVANLKKVLSMNAERGSALQKLFITMNYHPGFTAEEIYNAHLRWGRTQVVCSLELPPLPNNPDPGKRLRIGYVSPDFRSHSVAYFIAPVLANHDRSKFEIFCYSDVPERQRDDITRYLQALDVHWRDNCGKDDPNVAQEIRQDGIDILVDLAGHTVNNRLGVFAHRTAPVQITYLGYPNTTGLPTMDYRLTDGQADPVGAEKHYTEELIRFPCGFLCYSPIRETPEIGDLPAFELGFVTFGSFNAPTKTTPQMFALWARVLNAVPNSRILLKNHSLRHFQARERYHALFEQHGISRDRVELAPMVPNYEEHFRYYNRVDIALDPFPYNGTTTTCEALWMGVPVITLEGSRHVSRVGTSILSQLGLTECIARDPSDYIVLAEALAKDLDRLASLRSNLRERMHASLLCDGKTFTRKLEGSYQKFWQRWCIIPTEWQGRSL